MHKLFGPGDLWTYGSFVPRAATSVAETQRHMCLPDSIVNEVQPAARVVSSSATLNLVVNLLEDVSTAVVLAQGEQE